MKLSSTSSLEQTIKSLSQQDQDQFTIQERLSNQKENLCQNTGVMSQLIQAQTNQQFQFVQLYSDENADKQQEGSLTTNESCSSYHSDDADDDDNSQHQAKMNLGQWGQYNQEVDHHEEGSSHHHHPDYENVYEQDEMQEKESEENDNEVSYCNMCSEQLQEDQTSLEKDQYEHEQPFQFKTLKLQSLKERGNLIYFEEYDPLNQSNRNTEDRAGVLMTGGRTASNASNSNRFSLSKTINFNMAMYYPQDLTVQTPTSQNHDSLQNRSSSQRENVPSSQQSLQSTAREKINSFTYNNNSVPTVTVAQNQSKRDMMMEKQNMGTQTLHEILSCYQLTPNKSVQSEVKQKDTSSELSSSFGHQNVFQMPFSAREEQSHHGPLSNLSNSNKPHSAHGYQVQQHHHIPMKAGQELITASPFSLKESNLSLNQLQSSNNTTVQKPEDRATSHNIQPHRLYQRVGALQNRASFQQHQVFAFAQTQNLQSSYSKGVSRKSEEMPQQRNSSQKNTHHERKWSESSNNQNQNSQGGFNGGISNISFSRTIALPNLGQISNSKKKKEDYIQDLKYMLENVQCEAKNLKLLLNLKDDQLQLYENKTIDLINENDEAQTKFDDIKTQYEMVEEENLYLKAVVNSFNNAQNIASKKTLGVTTESLKTSNQSCQVHMYEEHQSIGLSPIKELQSQYDQVASNNQKTLQKQVHESEKENMNLMNKLDSYAEKFKHQEMTLSQIQNDYGLIRKENNELKKQMQKDNNHLYWQIENQKVQMRDREQKIMEVYQALEENKHQTKKKSNKIKSLKKERDNLKIEILKLKQIYSDKCDIQKIIINNQYDNYKEIKHKLQKKLKKREEKIMSLEDKVNQCEQYYKKQISNRGGAFNMPEWALNDENINDFEQSSQFMRSSMRSKSLENTGNFNSTAKNQLKFQGAMNNLPPSQQVQTSSTSGNGCSTHYNNFITPYYNAFEEQQKKEKYGKQLEREVERHILMNNNQTSMKGAMHVNYYPGGAGGGAQTQNQNYISGDKSKSFYSSDVENNTFFDPTNIVLEDQSNSSNFFSNINNSNSHLFVDDSGIIMGDKINQYLGLPSTDQKQAKSFKPHNPNKYQPQQQQLPRVGSSHQIKIQNTQSSTTKAQHQQQHQHQQPIVNPKSSQPQVSSNHISKKKKKKNDSFSVPINQTPLNNSYLQSLQFEDQIPFTNQVLPSSSQQLTQQQQQNQLRCYTKSPISKNIPQQNMIPRNRSSSNLSQQQQQVHQLPSQEQAPQNTTQHTIRQQQNDSTTSSNRNLQQIKTATQRPTSTSSTNNTATTHHNQVAMVSYQSSSSGGSKNYSSKNPHPSQKISHASYLTSQHQLGQSYQSQQNSSSQFIQNYQIPQKNTGAVGNVQSYEHKRQRSRCFEQQQMGTGTGTGVSSIETNEKWGSKNPMRQSYVSQQQSNNHFNH